MPDSVDLSKLFPVGVVARASRYLREAEFDLRCKLSSLEGVSRTRRRAFSTGRTLAYQALRSLGEPQAKIFTGKHGEPLWPAGYVGSITHKTGFCIVGVAPVGIASGLGIDLEINEPLEAHLWARIACESELMQSGRPREIGKANLANLLFSAKESVFKCQSTVTGLHHLSHKQIKISFLQGSASFAARIVDAPHGGGSLGSLKISGKYLITNDFVVTSAIVEP